MGSYDIGENTLFTSKISTASKMHISKQIKKRVKTPSPFVHTVHEVTLSALSRLIAVFMPYSLAKFRDQICNKNIVNMK